MKTHFTEPWILATCWLPILCIETLLNTFKVKLYYTLETCLKRNSCFCRLKAFELDMITLELVPRGFFLTLQLTLLHMVNASCFLVIAGQQPMRMMEKLKGNCFLETLHSTNKVKNQLTVIYQGTYTGYSQHKSLNNTGLLSRAGNQFYR